MLTDKRTCVRISILADVKRLNSMLGENNKMSAAAFLFDVTPIELHVQIPTALSGFSIAQLQFPKGSVVVTARLNAQKKKLDKSPQLKLDANDVLVLKGVPHALATCCSVQGGQAVLLKPKESVAMRVHLKDERESLASAAQELHDRLLPHVRRQQLKWMEKRRIDAAATKIQSHGKERYTPTGSPSDV